MTATMEEVDEKRGSRRSKYRAVPDAGVPIGDDDIMNDIGADPVTAQEANAAYNEAVEEREEEANAALEWARSLELTSIKFTGGKAHITFEHGIEGFKAKTTAHSVGDVPTTFTAALNALVPHVASLIFLDEQERFWQAQRLAVNGINLKHHDEGNVHVGISFTLTLQNGRQINAAIPQMPLHAENPDVSAHEETAVRAIERLIGSTQTLLSKVEKTGTLF